MAVTLTSATDVFIFIIFCSIYVCSILWIYGDIATRGAGSRGMMLPLLFIIVGALALIEGHFIALIAWPAGYIAWFYMRPDTEIEQTE